MNSTKRIREIITSVLSPEDIRSMSAVEISVPKLQNGKIPIEHGLYDLRMGSVDNSLGCKTCMNHGDTLNECTGHYGHIMLATPVYNRLYMLDVIRLLKIVCRNCGQTLAHEYPPADHIDIHTPLSMLVSATKSVRVCRYCGMSTFSSVKLNRTKLGLDVTIHKEQGSKPLSAKKALEILSLIDTNTELVVYLRMIPKWTKPSSMIWQILPVVPPVTRPPAIQNAKRNENVLTIVYLEIIKSNLHVLQAGSGANYNASDYAGRVERLTLFCAMLYTPKILESNRTTHITKITPQSKTFAALIDKKSGLIRHNILGKRADNIARSVVSSDSMISVGEIGVPEVVAKILTVPEIVHSGNIRRLTGALMNGPDVFPGANIIIKVDPITGEQTRFHLEMLKHRELVQLNDGDIVERHMKNGDIVVFNRQPTVHKIGMLAHRAKIFAGMSSFRLALSACAPYNADFDGDEMNMHLPQSIEAINEARDIMHIENYVMSFKRPRPIIIPIQDSQLSLGKLTHSSTFVTLTDIGFIMSFYKKPYHIPKPAKIENGTEYWTGRQVLSFILPNINIKKTTKLYNDVDLYKQFDHIRNADGQLVRAVKGEDAYMVIENGQHISGIMDGTTLGLIVRIINNDYSSKTALAFVDDINRIATMFMILYGSTMGFDDFYVDNLEFYSDLKVIVNDVLARSTEKIKDIDRGSYIPAGSTPEKFIDMTITNMANNARSKSFAMLYKRTILKMPDAQLLAMRFMSTGGDDYIASSSGIVGQKTLYGKGRITRLYGDRTLPYYHRGDISAKAQGFIASSYMFGLSPAEMFLTSIGGRSGKVQSSIAVSSTGYVSKEIVKLVEDIYIQHDGIVVDTKEQVFSLLYGNDGMSTMRLEHVYLPYTKMDRADIETEYMWTKKEILKHSMSERERDAVKVEYEQILSDKVFVFTWMLNGKSVNLERTFYAPFNMTRIMTNARNRTYKRSTPLTPTDVIRLVDSTCDALAMLYYRFYDTPTIYEESTTFYKIIIRSYLNSHALIINTETSKEQLLFMCEELKNRYVSAYEDPGSLVGGTAYNAVLEPLTQKTLDAFKMSGGASGLRSILPIDSFREKLASTNTLSDKHTIIFSKSSDVKYCNKLRDQLDNLQLSNYTIKSEVIYDNRFTDIPRDSDKELVDSFIRNTPDASDMLSSCGNITIRIELNKHKMIRNMTNITTVVYYLRIKYPAYFFIGTSENAEEYIILVKANVQHSEVRRMFQRYGEIEQMSRMEDNIINTVLSGVEGFTGIDMVSTKSEEYFDVETLSVRRRDVSTMTASGNNLRSVMTNSMVDTTRTVSNNIVETCAVLGIEAARQLLIDLTSVIVSGIFMRHYEILADKITFRGRPITYKLPGLVINNSGLTNYLTRESIVESFGRVSAFTQDGSTEAVSSNIMLGQDMVQGTGMMSEYVYTPSFGNFSESTMEELENL